MSCYVMFSAVPISSVLISIVCTVQFTAVQSSSQHVSHSNKLPGTIGALSAICVILFRMHCHQHSAFSSSPKPSSSEQFLILQIDTTTHWDALAQFLFSHLFKDLVPCLDKSRHRIVIWIGF